MLDDLHGCKGWGEHGEFSIWSLVLADALEGWREFGLHSHKYIYIVKLYPTYLNFIG
jgi:hypothetical protein